MNIFVTNKNPYVCARILDDKRVVKMVLESTQMLSTCLHHFNPKDPPPYKLTHKNHPCNIWIRKSSENYKWLLTHLEALLKEYSYRYTKTHKCSQYLEYFKDSISCIPKGDLIPFENCTPYKHYETIYAYNLTMFNKWSNDIKPPTWYGNKLNTSEQINILLPNFIL